MLESSTPESLDDFDIFSRLLAFDLSPCIHLLTVQTFIKYFANNKISEDVKKATVEKLLSTHFIEKLFYLFRVGLFDVRCECLSLFKIIASMYEYQWIKTHIFTEEMMIFLKEHLTLKTVDREEIILRDPQILIFSNNNDNTESEKVDVIEKCEISDNNINSFNSNTSIYMNTLKPQTEVIKEANTEKESESEKEKEKEDPSKLTEEMDNTHELFLRDTKNKPKSNKITYTLPLGKVSSSSSIPTVKKSAHGFSERKKFKAKKSTGDLNLLTSSISDDNECVNNVRNLNVEEIDSLYKRGGGEKNEIHR